MRTEEGVLMRYADVIVGRGIDSRVHVHRGKLMRTWWEGGHCKSRIERLRRNLSHQADFWILNIPPPKLWKNKFLSFKPPSLWHFCFGSSLSNIIHKPDDLKVAAIVLRKDRRKMKKYWTKSGLRSIFRSTLWVWLLGQGAHWKQMD
jgi:hypothetical protein